MSTTPYEKHQDDWDAVLEKFRQARVARKQTVLRMRADGMSFRAIAAVLGQSPSWIRQIEADPVPGLDEHLPPPRQR